jgi:predicted kinase
MTSLPVNPVQHDERQDFARVLASVEPLPRPRAWPALLVLVGPPGAGKSSLAKRLQARTPLVVLCADEIRQLLIPAADFSFDETKRVQRAMRLALGDLLHRNITVAFDAPNLTEWERQPLYSLAALHQARLIVIEVTAPTAVVLQRLAAMPAQPAPAVPAAALVAARAQSPGDVYHQMVQRQEPITREHLTIDTSVPGLEQFVEALALDLDEG